MPAGPADPAGPGRAGKFEDGWRGVRTGSGRGRAGKKTHSLVPGRVFPPLGGARPPAANAPAARGAHSFFSLSLFRAARLGSGLRPRAGDRGRRLRPAGWGRVLLPNAMHRLVFDYSYYWTAPLTVRLTTPAVTGGRRTPSSDAQLPSASLAAARSDARKVDEFSGCAQTA